MNRTIKYRAWDSEEERMVYSDAGEDDYIWQLDYDGLVLLRHETDNEENHFYPKIEAPFMEYSGLQDKNNKDIYEGDITRVWGGDDCDIETNIIRIIKFDEYELGYECNTPGGDECKLTKANRHQLEVIGNIYENQDLIK